MCDTVLGAAAQQAHGSCFVPLKAAICLLDPLPALCRACLTTGPAAHGISRRAHDQLQKPANLLLSPVLAACSAGCKLLSVCGHHHHAVPAPTLLRLAPHKPQCSTHRPNEADAGCIRRCRHRVLTILQHTASYPWRPCPDPSKGDAGYSGRGRGRAAI